MKTGGVGDREVPGEGPVTSNGYVSREMSNEKIRALNRAGISLLSERAFQEIFAEAVLGSRRNHTSGVELTSGIRVDGEETDKNIWTANPMFSHLVSRREKEADVTGQRNLHDSIQTRLQAATSAKKVFEVLKGESIFHVKSYI